MLAMLKPIGLPRGLGMTRLAGWWLSKGLETIPMWVIASVAGSTRSIGFLLTALCGVAFVAVDLAMRPAEVKLGARKMIEGVLLEGPMLGRVAPVAALGVEKHVLMGRLMTTRVTTVAGLGTLKIK